MTSTLVIRPTTSNFIKYEAAWEVSLPARLVVDTGILAGFQGLVKDGNERQGRDWAGAARGERIAATARRA